MAAGINSIKRKHPARSCDTINVASGMPSSHCLGSAGSKVSLAESRLRRKRISNCNLAVRQAVFDLSKKNRYAAACADLLAPNAGPCV